MNHRTPISVLVLVLLLMSSSLVPAHAEPQPVGLRIQLLEEIEGTLDSGTPEQRYTLSLFEGQVFSVLGWAWEGDLALDIAVYDPSGTLIAAGTSFEMSSGPYYVAEAVVPPQTGDYEIVAALSGQASGEFGLLAMPGYGFPLVWDHFDGQDDFFGLQWTPTDDSEVFSGIVNDEYLIQLKQPDLSYTIMSDDLMTFPGDIYVEVDVRREALADQYHYGLALRADGMDEAFHYYQVVFTAQGEWAVGVFRNGEYTRIHKEQSPLIDTSQPTARIGVLVQGYTFSVFYNGQYLGQATDTNQYYSDGGIAFLAARPPEQEAVSIYFDNLLITMASSTVVAATQGNAAEESSKSGVGDLLDQSQAGEAAEEPDELPFDLGGKSLGLPVDGVHMNGNRIEGVNLP